MLITILLVAAFIIFGIAAWKERNLVALGLAVWVLVDLIPRLI